MTSVTPATRTSTFYVPRHVDSVDSETRLARDIAAELAQVAGRLDVVTVAIAPVSGGGVDCAAAWTAGVLVTVVLRAP